MADNSSSQGWLEEQTPLPDARRSFLELASLSRSGFKAAGNLREAGASQALVTAPTSGMVTVTTAGSNFRNALAVYTGDNVSTLSVMAAQLAGAGTNTSQVTFDAVAGATYHIAVDGFNGSSGNVAVNLMMSEAGLALEDFARKSDGGFQFTITGPAGQVFRIEAGDTLTNWSTIATLTNITGSLPFIDLTATNRSKRFYRAVSP